MSFKFKKYVAAVLVVTMLVQVLSLTAFAEEREGKKYTNGDYTAVKLSNPSTGEGEADGLEVGTDRLNSYAWCMEQLGDYIYIGSNRDFMYYGVVQHLLMNEGMDQDLINSLLDVVTNGEIPTTYYNKQYGVEKGIDSIAEYWTQVSPSAIVRYNTKTKTMETYFDSGDYPYDSGSEYSMISGFRGAKTFKNALYMNGIKLNLATMSPESHLYKITNDAELPVDVEGLGGGSNLRAMTLSEDKETFYLGGTKPADDDQDFKPVVYMTTDGDTFEEIITDEDLDEDGPFYQYITKGAGYWSGDNGDVWDLAEFQGKLYMTFWTEKGSPAFVGTYNKYENDWEWEEFAGDSIDSPYPIGFGTGEFEGLTQAMTPYVFKGDLYFITFSDTVKALISAAKGLFSYMTEDVEKRDINTVFDGYKDMEDVLKNQTSVYRLTKNGKMQMVVGDRNMCPKGIEYVAKKGSGFNTATMSTTLYNWRGAIYNDKFYIGTLDASTLYKYFSSLTNGQILNMDRDQIRKELGYVEVLLKKILGGDEELLKSTLPDSEENDEMLEAIDVVAELMKENAETLNVETTEEITEEEKVEAAEEKTKTAEEKAEVVEETEEIVEATTVEKAEIVEVTEEKAEAVEETEEKAEVAEETEEIVEAATEEKAGIVEVTEEKAEGTEESEEKTEVIEELEETDEIKEDDSEIVLDKLADLLYALLQDIDKKATQDLIYGVLENKDAVVCSLRGLAEDLREMAIWNPQLRMQILMVAGVVDGLADHYANVKQEGIDRYIRISKTIENNTKPGFELYCTENGVDYDTVTLTGFKDKYNYGVRTLLTANDGKSLYLGTANPFYGAQLWNITDKEVKPDPKPVPPGGGGSSAQVRPFTGTWDNPVRTGTWSLDTSGYWHYTTTEMFRSTWAYIYNPYAKQGQHESDWFYFDGNGNMLTGWEKINNAWYYLYPFEDGSGTLGACLIGPAWTPDGYEVDANGAWTGKKK